MKKTKLSKTAAKELAKKAGWDFSKDYHAQDSPSKVEDLRAIARLVGYKKPANASGSTGRYFFHHLKKY